MTLSAFKHNINITYQIVVENTKYPGVTIDNKTGYTPQQVFTMRFVQFYIFLVGEQERKVSSPMQQCPSTFTLENFGNK